MTNETNETNVLTGERALKLLEDVVHEKGESYVYPYDECVYVQNPEMDDDYDAVISGAPACIVGHVLDKAGLLFGVHGRLTSVVSYNEEAGALAESPYVTEDAARVLLAAQRIQDGTTSGTTVDYGRGTWGQALAVARLAYENPVASEED